MAIANVLSRAAAYFLMASLFGSALAAESKPATYTAKIKFLQVTQNGAKRTAIETEVGGVKGKPVKTALGGQNGVVVNLEMQDLAASSQQYVAQFRIVETLPDGKQNIVSAPKITVVAGNSGCIMLGESTPEGEKGDRIEIEFLVTEKN